MTTERHDFRLNFQTDQNEIMSFNVPHADATATGLELADAMQAIIASGAVQSVRGIPLFRHSADLITTESREYDI